MKRPGDGELRQYCLWVHDGHEMCGRYSLIADLGELAQRFEFNGDRLTFEPAYNVAPTQQVLTVVGGDTRRGGFMRWGLIPHWAKNASIGGRMINARAETVAEKPAFRDALRRRRCLVLADGFYEWQRSGTARRPHAPWSCGPESHSPSRACGRCGETPNGNRVPSCAIITTAANELLRPIHDRMPVVLPKELEEFWLDASVEDAPTLTGIMASCPAGAMEAFEVSRLVNSVANDAPEVVAPVGEAR